MAAFGLSLACVRGAAALLGFAFAAASLAQTLPIPDRSDPRYQSTGDQNRTYKFPQTGETVPYRLYVPSQWKPGKKLPLVIILHGGGLDENAPFDRAPDTLKGILAAQAEKHGFIVAAPSGYDVNALWGSSFGYGTKGPQPKPKVTPEELARINPRAEQDVLNVVALMRQEYGVDRSRIFLMGNSRGSMGALYLAESHPELWLAIAPSDGPIAEVDTYPYDRLTIKGAIFVHGSKDLVPIDMNRAIAGHIEERGIVTEFDEVPDGEHGTSWYMALPRIFDFLDSFPRK